VELVRPQFGAHSDWTGPSRRTRHAGTFDGEAARRDLGYEPEWTIERGLADYAEWLKTHEA
jgi:nucleoside-diphosphate-sugar epimerase